MNRYEGKKIGRNELCPCGSGLKFKHCHGKDKFMDLIGLKVMGGENSNGIIIKDSTGNKTKTYELGSPGFIMSGFYSSEGDFEIVKKNPENYNFEICFDIPHYFPLEDDCPFEVLFEENKFTLFHKTKRRGEEFFSTIDTLSTPYFSSFRIEGTNFFDKIPTSNPSDPYESYKLIISVLQRLNNNLPTEHRYDINFNLKLSYFITYFEKEDLNKTLFILKITYPYSGIIDIKAPSNSIPLNNTSLKNLFTEKIKIESYFIKKVGQYFETKSFTQNAFQTLHDFSFYCCQHPKTFQSLHEALIRDLYLVIVKVIFSYAEGEAFNYDGRLDYKITNRENKYEFITGEFKWWTGDNSFKEAFHQAIRKHANGMEKVINIVILNRNEDLSSVYQKVLELLINEPEYIKQLSMNISPDGSRQLFSSHLVNVKGCKITVIIGLINLYYSNL
jgi:hypothetical protein